MTTYIQRQFAGFLAPGTNTDPVTYSLQSRVWDFKDVYPASILKIAEGLQIDFETTIAASGTLTLPRPEGYTDAERLFVLIRSNVLVKLVTIHPVSGTSTSLLRPGLATDQNGYQSFSQRVTSIVVSNPSSTTATIQYMAFQYPDLTLSASYRDGYQTTGVLVTN